MKKVTSNLVLSMLCLSHAIIISSSSARLFYQLIVLLALIINLGACNEEEPTAATIQFTSAMNSVAEGAQTTLAIKLDKAALSDGSIEIQVETSAVYDKHFITDPAMHNGSLTLPVRRGQTAASFIVFALSNKQYDKGKIIRFTLSKASQGLHLGASVTKRLLIEDDENACLAYFELSEGRLAENTTTGTMMEVLLSAPTKEDGSITINLGKGDAVYGLDFTTLPSATNNTIVLPVKQNTTSTSFLVVPIDNDLFKGNVKIPFVISSVNGTSQKDIEYMLTIEDDELPSIATFALSQGILSQDDDNGFNVEILLSNKASGSGKLSVLLGDAGNGTKFTTDPVATGNIITLDILPGATKTGFKILPIENSVCGDFEFAISISAVSGVVTKNNPNSFQMIITGKEGSTVTFAQKTGYVSENSKSGVVVLLTLSQPALNDYTINVTCPQFPSYTVYYTIPGPTYDSNSLYIPVKVKKGTTQSEFTIYPIDNFSASVNRILKFNFTNYNGCLTGSDSFTLTVEDDD